jgi:ATP-dependent Clp protease adaptor protein ClpS
LTGAINATAQWPFHNAIGPLSTTSPASVAQGAPWDDSAPAIILDGLHGPCRKAFWLPEHSVMTKTLVKPRTKVRTKTQRPPLYKVILLNDDFTPREFVVLVLKAVFRMNEDQAYRVMMTAHQKGACVIAVYARDVAETKAKEATELGKQKGYPLFFTTEPEE